MSERVLSEREMGLLRHAVGGDVGHRGYVAVQPGSPDAGVVEGLAEAGLMVRGGEGDPRIWGSLVFYFVTPEGKRVAHRDRPPAWECWTPSLGMDPDMGQSSLVRAPTRSKARYLHLMAVRESYEDVTFADIRVRRAVGFDDADFSQGVMPKYVHAPDAGGTDER
jgi:hypothetical protein